MLTCEGWYVQYKDLGKDLVYNEKFDYLVVCSGIEDSHKLEDQAAINANLMPNYNPNDRQDILEVFDEITQKALKKSQNTDGTFFSSDIVAKKVPKLAFIGAPAKDISL